MRTLHYYPNPADALTAGYVATLCEHTPPADTCDQTTSAADACQRLQGSHYDLLHMHGCWHNAMWRVARAARKNNTRLVLSPHGQLEPWIIDENYWREKLPKTLLYQRRLVRRAYTVLVEGKMEEECLRRLGWNSRLVTVRNSLLTQSVSKQEMSRQVYDVYRRIMDSNTLELMTDDTKTTLRQMLKVGITGNRKWLRDDVISISDESQWRALLCFIHQEQIADIALKGLYALGLEPPMLSTDFKSCVLPDGYNPAQTTNSAIGLEYATENDRLTATFRFLRKAQQRRQLTILHLTELSRELFTHDTDEESLCEELREERLYHFAARLMQLCHELTGLDEGFMPMPPKDDRTTHRIRTQINNHLSI